MNYIQILKNLFEYFRMWRKSFKSSNKQESNTVYLNIYIQGSGLKFKARKISLDLKKCNEAKYRFSSDGWGMIQLHLSTNTGNRLCNSYTNHNTLKRAEEWENFYKNLDSPS